MILNDDPSPIGHLGEQVRHIINKKCSGASIMRAARVHYKKFLVGVSIFVLILLEQTSVVSGSTRPAEHDAVSLVAQKYTTCVVRTGLFSGNQGIALGADEACADEAVYGDRVHARTEQLHELLAEHPMAAMADALAQEDPQVAAFLIGIGKIESNWGKRSPWKAGRDCYNYWGYKSSGSRGQALGHACFGSPEEAVETVAKRVHHFVYDTGRDTPEKLLVWKCGSSCASHDPTGVARWVATVRTYSQKARALDQDTTQTRLLSRK